MFRPVVKAHGAKETTKSVAIFSWLKIDDSRSWYTGHCILMELIWSIWISCDLAEEKIGPV